MAGSSTQGKDIQKLKTDIALIQKDIKYQSEAMRQLDVKIDRMTTTVENLKYVPYDLYQVHLQSEKEIFKEINDRVSNIEQFIEDNRTGIKFSTSFTSNLLLTVASVGGIGALIYVGAKLVTGN